MNFIEADQSFDQPKKTETELKNQRIWHSDSQTLRYFEGHRLKDNSWLPAVSEIGRNCQRGGTCKSEFSDCMVRREK